MLLSDSVFAQRINRMDRITIIFPVVIFDCLFPGFSLAQRNSFSEAFRSRGQIALPADCENRAGRVSVAILTPNLYCFCVAKERDLTRFCTLRRFDKQCEPLCQLSRVITRLRDDLERRQVVLHSLRDVLVMQKL